MRRAGHSRCRVHVPRSDCNGVSQLLSLMSVTDERRIGYCGGNQCFCPGGLPLSVVLALVGCAPAAVGLGQAPNVPHQQDEPRDTSGMR